MTAFRTESEIMQYWEGNIDIPVVSICCTTYNHESYIEEAINGFLMQETDFPFEILIRDDCSTDKTASIVKFYAEKYPNLIKPVFEKENTYSKGVKPLPELYKRAKGKYIAVCEGDDYWTDPQKLKIQKEFLDSNPDFAMHTHAVDIIDNTKQYSSYQPYFPMKKNICTFEDILMHHFIPTLSLFFRRQYLPNPLPPFYKHIRSGDIATELMLAAHGKCFYDTKKMGVYRHHDGGITKMNKLDIQVQKDKAYILYVGIDIYTNFKYSSEIKRRLAYCDYTAFGQHLKNKELGYALQELIQMMKKDFLLPIRIFQTKIRNS